MAGDKSQKTEKPTERKKKKARKDGQVARSPDIVPWLLVFIATFILPAYLGRARDLLGRRLGAIRSVSSGAEASSVIPHLGGAMTDLFTLVVPILVASAVIAIAVSFAQTGFILSTKALVPKPSRLNPIAGLKRLVSPRGQWEAIKAALRMTAVAMVAAPLVVSVGHELTGKSAMSLDVSLGYLGARLIQLARTVALLGLLISVADYAVQRKNHLRDLRMSKEEIKQESKQTEGDPLLKGRMKQAAQALSRNRMLSDVSDATAIVVNPTHFAVAIRYDEAVGVPIVVAKGAGDAALRIRSEGLDRSIAVVECKPLARALFRICDVGTPVPRELFQAVAVLLAFIHRLGARRSLGGVPIMPDDESALGLGDLRVNLPA